MRRLLILLACLPGLLFPFRAGAAADDGPNILTDASMDDFVPTYEVWKGVDDDGNLRVPIGYYPIVNEAGVLEFSAFPPSVATFDAIGGLLDLVVADSQGHLWYYANTGTKKAPKFDSGLPLPFLLNPVSLTIQAVDLNGDGRPDLLMGDGLGGLFVVINSGDRVPKFTTPERPELVQVKTRGDNKAWCNFLTPAYAAWCDPERRDLLMGDGTYASDNVYYLKNREDTGGKPQLDDPVIAIEGGGREQLFVCPWYRTPGGKPDLLVGDRTGKLVLYTNVSTKDDTVPHFKDPQPLRLGGEESFGPMARFTVADLNGDGIPDLIFTQQDGSIQVAYNIGTAAAPKFDHADPLTGPSSKALARPGHWSMGAPEWGNLFPPGSFFQQMTIVGANPGEPSTYEKGFDLPEKSAEKHALKFSFAEPPASLAALYPVIKDKEGQENYGIRYAPDGVHGLNYPMLSNTHYEFSFDIKGSGFEKLVFSIYGQQIIATKGDAYSRGGLGFREELSLTGDWHHVHFPFNFTTKGNPTPIGFAIGFNSYGKGTYYFTNFTIRELK